MRYRVPIAPATVILGLVLVAATAPSPRSTTVPKAAPCALAASPKAWQSDIPCAAFTIMPVRILAAFPNTVFGGHEARAIALLNNGSVVVQTGAGLSRIDPQRRVSQFMSACNEHHIDELMGSFGDEILGAREDGIFAIRPDGSVAFRWAPPFDIGSPHWPGYGAHFLGRDRDGIIWIERSMGSGEVVGYSPPSKRTTALGAWPFLGPSGYLYEPTTNELMLVRALGGHLYRRSVRGPIRVPVQAFNPGAPAAPALAIPVQRLGPDGSAWASTTTEVIHEHANGEVRVIRLAPSSLQQTHPSGLIGLTIAPDGSAWIGSRQLIRIGEDDRVQVLDVPGGDAWELPSFAPDGSAWAIATDAVKGANEGIVHFLLWPSGRPGMNKSAFVNTRNIVTKPFVFACGKYQCSAPDGPPSAVALVEPPYPDDVGLAQPFREDSLAYPIKVDVRVTVGPDGNLIKTEIARSSGREDVDQAALWAVHQDTFLPKVVNCRPTTASFVMHFY